MWQCPRCNEELENNKCFWCGYEHQEREPLWVPGSDFIGGYEMMPLLDEWNGYKFYFEKGEVITHPYQPHVHVKGHGGHVKVVLEPHVHEEKNQTYGLREHKITKILKYANERKTYFLEKWNEAKRDAGME